MKKIAFSNKYGLTNAVIQGHKTMTRRIIPINLYNQTDWKAVEEGDYEAVVDGDENYHDIRLCGRYQIGEEVAVAMNYKNVLRAANKDESVWRFLVEKGLMQSGGAVNTELITNAGYGNKMFVKAEYMPYSIIITGIDVKRLQDIRDEDCLKEGIFEDAEEHGGLYTTPFYDFLGNDENGFYSPREAFAALIDRICGRGTWERNPWVFAYSFNVKRASGF